MRTAAGSIFCAAALLLAAVPAAAAEEKEKPDGAAGEIAAAIRAVSPAIRLCFDAGLRENRDLEGRLTIELKGGKDGAPEGIRVLKDELGSAAVAACIMAKIKDVRLPASAAGKTITYPFTFAPTRTLAVLPFDNLTGDRSLDWLKSGAAESLVTKLGQVPSLVLVDRMKLDAVLAEQALSQSGALDEKAAIKAGKMTGAQRVIVGAFQRAGRKTRLTARVIEVETGKIRETAMADGRLDDIFALQDQLAAKVADVLNLVATPERDAALALRIGTSRPIIELLGKANNALCGAGEPRDVTKAALLFRQVIAADPRIPEGHLGLALSLWRTKTDEGAREIQAALRKAIELRPGYYEAMTYLGFNLWLNRRPDEAFELQKKAVALKPDFAMGYYGLAIAFGSGGRADEAFAALARAEELDPRNGEFVTQHGHFLTIFKRDFTGALACTARALKMPDASEWSWAIHGYVQMMAGDPEGCIASVREGRKRRDPADTGRSAGESLAIEASCTAKAGRLDEAKAIWEKIPQDGMHKLIMSGAPWPKEMPEVLWRQLDDLLAPLAPFIPPRPPRPPPAR